MSDIFTASGEGNIERIKELLDSGTNVNMIDTDINKWTALMLSADAGNINVVQLLLERGANVNMIDYSGRTALIMATISGSLDIVNLLIRNGADINIWDNNDHNALDYARQKNFQDIIDILLPLTEPIPSPLPIITTQCTICMEDKNFNIKGNNPFRIRVLPCGHTFHQTCIKKIIDNICPICRAPFVTYNNIMLGGYYQKYQKYFIKLN